MQVTFDIYNDRKSEIDFYFSVIKGLDNEDIPISTNNNPMLIRIMKSNLILMLYNITEACITSGLKEIFQKINSEHISYTQIISQIQEHWTNYEIKQLFDAKSPLKAHQQTTRDLISHVLNQTPLNLSFNKKFINMEGNLDSKKIQEICKNYNIRHKATGTPSLLTIKQGRNNLAHGNESFSQYAQSISISELEKYKDDVLSYLKKILDGMKDYYDNRGYCVQSLPAQ